MESTGVTQDQATTAPVSTVNSTSKENHEHQQSASDQGQERRRRQGEGRRRQEGLLSDEELNAALNAEMDSPGYQSRENFKRLDAEMTRRETEASSAHSEGQTQSTESIQENVQEADVSTTSESSEKTSEDNSTESESVSAGKLSLFDAGQADNRVATGFTQEDAREGDRTKRPLVVLKDALGSLVDRAEEFVGEKLNDQQLMAVKTFVGTAKDWFGQIQKNLPKMKRPEYRFEDAMQYLLDENGTVDENVMTAITYAAFSWVASEATAPKIQDKKSVNRILGLQKDAWAGHEAYELLGSAGSYQHLLMDSLGGAVMDALGLKAKDTTSQELASKLRAALGAQALKLLEDQGLVKRTMIPGNVITQLRGLPENPKDITHYDKAGRPVYVPHYFFAIARGESGKVVPMVDKIYQANKGTKTVLEKVFKVASNIRVPLLTPSTETSANTKGTAMKVPDELKAILLANQNHARYVQQDKLALFGQFSEEELYTMFGLEHLEGKHLVNRHGVEAKNDGLIREYQLFIEFVGEYLGTAEKGLDTPFFYEFQAWKQQRVGIATTVGNPQTSKIARFLVHSKDWVTKVESTDMDSFFLRVAEGLGMKTERADNAVSLLKVKEKLSEDVFVDAVQALRKSVIHGEELTAEEKAAIVAGVEAGGENLHSLDALIGVAQQQEAQSKAEGQDYSFEVKMMGEVDGVANGTMLNHILMGAGMDAASLQAILNAGGFYAEGSGHTQYNQWRGTKGNLDIYEMTARAVHRAVNEMFSGNEKVAAIWGIAGDIFDVSQGTVTKDGRNLVKDALNPLAFGSAMSSVIRGMSDAFLANVYKGFEKLAAKDATQAEVDAYVKHLNIMLAGSKARALPLGRPIAWHMEQPLHPSVEGTLKKAFADTVGKATTSVVENMFGEFLQRRDSLNETTNVAYGLSNAVYQGEREAFIEELLAKGEIPLDSKGNRIGDLSKVQEAELKKRLRSVEPVIQTLMSAGDKASGLRMSKTKRKQNAAPEYANQSQFGTPMGNGKKSVKIHGFSTQQEEPGVAMGSATTHSTDSGISHRTQAVMDVLNVHDAVGTGVGQLGEAARLMNQNTWEAALTYSPLESAHQALASMVRGLAEMQAKGALSPQSVKHLQDYLNAYAEKNNKNKNKLAVSPEGVISRVMELSKAEAFKGDSIKLELLSKLGSVDQYAFQGGNYEVTEADRAKAKGMLDKLSQEIAAKDAEAVKALAQIMSQSLENIKATPVAKAAEEENSEPVVEGDTNEGGELDLDMDLPPWETSAPVTSPFGTVGQPAQVNKDLVDFFKKNPNTTAKNVLAQLLSMVDAQKNPFQRLLIGMLQKSVVGSMPVRLVTPKTQKTDVKEMPLTASFGWFAGGEIYVLSEDFVNSGLQTPEVLLHELVHGAVAQIIEAELSKRDGPLDAAIGKRDASKGNPKYTSSAMKLVAELEALMEEAKKVPGAEKFSGALADVQEFVAYGMTRTSFQHLLAQVHMPTKQHSNKLVSINGFKEFISKLVRMLFDKSGSKREQKEQMQSGLATLIRDVAGLMNQATQEKKALNLSAAVQAFTTLDVHNALDGTGLTSAFDDKLSTVLNGIVRSLHGPFGAFKNDVMQRTYAAATPEEIWLKALDTGMAPLALSVRASPIRATDRELHAMEQVEAVMKTALAGSEVSTRSAYTELTSLFAEMKSKIKPSDFNNQAEYDFIFNVSLNADGKSDHLARFAAFALAHQGFNLLMQQATDTTAMKLREKMSFADKVQAIFDRILSLLSERITHTFAGQRADKKMEALVGQLVDIEARKKATIENAARVDKFDPTVYAEMVVDKSIALAKKGVLKLADTDLVKKSSSTKVKLVGSLVRLRANDQVEYLMKNLADFRDKTFPGLPTLVTEVWNEFRGPDKLLNMLQLMTTHTQGQRKQIITQTSKAALAAFEGGGEYLKELGGRRKGKETLREAKSAISQVFLRTGMHVLLDQHSMAEIEQLLVNAQTRDQLIAATEAQLNDIVGVSAYADHFIHQANALGYFKVTGKVKVQRLMMNSHNIARLYGTSYRGRLTEAQSSAAQPIIEKLTALYAMEYVSTAQRNMAREILQHEEARGEGANGVEFVLRLHKNLEQSSKSELFRNQEALMMHGYTSEIYNSSTVAAVANTEDGRSLRDQGYTKVGRVEIDPADPDKEIRDLYILRDGGLARFQTGVMSYSGKSTKGSTQHSGYLNVNTDDGLANASLNADIAAAKPAGLSRGQRPDLSEWGRTYMAPVVNPQGQIVNWRYMMHDDTKDVHLQRDSRFDNVLGVMAGSIFDKPKATEENTKVLQALKDIYREEGHTRAGSFVQVGPKSTDPKMREIWSMLPDETKAAARRIFGSDSILIKKDMLLPVFGFRQYSLAEMFRKEPEQRAYAEKVIAGSIEQILVAFGRINERRKGNVMSYEEGRRFAKKAAVLVTRGEKAWQEIVHEMKDIIVVKSIKVMVDNMRSNWSFLVAAGVPLKDILRGHLVAMRAAMAHEKDTAALNQLQIQMSVGQAPANATQEVARLKDSLARNPARELFEAGLMPSIVEDVAADDEGDLYSYKSQLAQKVDTVAEKLTPKLVTVIRNVYIAHDTKIYQALSRATRLSDFLGRYTLYQHLLTQGVPKEDAVHESSEAFVNYDMPLPKQLQYLDVMGIMPFMKYYFRIQRVLMDLVKTHPGRVLGTVLLSKFVSLGPIVLDGFWMHKLGNNPLQWGALEAPGTINDLGTIAGGLSLLPGAGATATP